MQRMPVVSLAEGAMDQLLAYDWPGNVRELENIVERSTIVQGNGVAIGTRQNRCQAGERSSD